MRRAGSVHRPIQASFWPGPTKLLLAIAVGIVLGLLVSFSTISHRSFRRSVAEATVVQQTLVHKITQQEARLVQESQRQKDTLAEAGQHQAKVADLQTEVEDLRTRLLKAEALANAAAGDNYQAVQRQANAHLAKQTITAERHTPWQPSPERAAADPELAEVLAKVAVNNEVLVAISNRNYAGQGSMLATWIECVQRVGVGNAMVVALDDDTQAYMESTGLASVRFSMKISESQKHVGENHAVSGLKFKILRRFLELGFAVFLSDVDIVTLQNPFNYLVRDSDVESMSDGWDNATAYGYNDVKDDPAMGWARYAHSMRVFCFNSGLFFMRPTAASIALLDKVAHRIETEDGWDQAIFNEVIFFPAHGPYQDPSVTRRVLDIYDFMNSKVLFVQVRHDRALKSRIPVMIHVNYHPDKHSRMLAIVQRYVNGNTRALDPFPNGSEH